MAATEVERLVVRLTGDMRQYQKMLADAQTQTSRAAAGISRAFSKASSGIVSMGNMFAQNVARVTKVGAGMAIASAGWGIKLAADSEQVKVAFTTMLGSAREAELMMKRLDAFAASTPFQLPEIQRSAKMLLAFGYSANEVEGTLRNFGDVAAGIGMPLEELAEIMGKNRVQGRMFQMDLNQLQGRGIPIIAELAKVFGVAQGEIREMVESGQVEFKHLEAAMQNLTAEGGKFAGLMEAQSKTVAGTWSTLKDNVNAALREVGESIIKAVDLTTLIQNTTKFVQFFSRSWKDVITYASLYWASMFVELFENAKFFFTDQLVPLLKAFPRMWFEAFKSILVNAQNFGIALWEAIKGNGWSFQFEGLSDAFHDELNKIPKMADRPLSELEKAMAADMGYIADRMGRSWNKAFDPAAAATVTADAAPAMAEFNKVDAAVGKAAKTGYAAAGDASAVRGGSVAFERMRADIRPQTTMKNKAEERSEKYLEEIAMILREQKRTSLADPIVGIANLA